MDIGKNTPETDETRTTFKLGYVPGVTPSKWVGMWKERRAETPIELIQLPALDAGESIRTRATTMSLVRLPIDREGLHAIELYRETPVVVFPKDHHFAAADRLTVADLAEEVVHHPLDCPLDWEELPGVPAVERLDSTKMTLEVVAAGVGVVVVPQSVARLLHRKDLTYLPVEGAPHSAVALVWDEFIDDPDYDEFVGIVRGRKASSSRSQHSNPEQQKAAEAEAKAAAKAERAKRVAAKQKQNGSAQRKAPVRTPSGRKPGTGGVAGKAKGKGPGSAQTSGKSTAKGSKSTPRKGQTKRK